MIVKLVYRDKRLSPYVTRITAPEPPKTIIRKNIVFSNLSIHHVGNSLVYQYREIPVVEISSVELKAPVPIKFESQAEFPDNSEAGQVLTAKQLRDLLKKCPYKERVFCDSSAIRLVERRFCRKEHIWQVWLHSFAPTWENIGVKIVRESKDRNFVETTCHSQTTKTSESYQPQ